VRACCARPDLERHNDHTNQPVMRSLIACDHY